MITARELRAHYRPVMRTTRRKQDTMTTQNRTDGDAQMRRDIVSPPYHRRSDGLLERVADGQLLDDGRAQDRATCECIWEVTGHHAGDGECPYGPDATTPHPDGIVRRAAL